MVLIMLLPRRWNRNPLCFPGACAVRLIAGADVFPDPPVTFRLDLTGNNEAKLFRIPQEGPEYVRMVRQKP
jgi:hypothetical protein